MSHLAKNEFHTWMYFQNGVHTKLCIINMNRPHSLFSPGRFLSQQCVYAWVKGPIASHKNFGQVFRVLDEDHFTTKVKLIVYGNIWSTPARSAPLHDNHLLAHVNQNMDCGFPLSAIAIPLASTRRVVLAHHPSHLQCCYTHTTSVRYFSHNQLVTWSQCMDQRKQSCITCGRLWRHSTPKCILVLSTGGRGKVILMVKFGLMLWSLLHQLPRVERYAGSYNSSWSISSVKEMELQWCEVYAHNGWRHVVCAWIPITSAVVNCRHLTVLRAFKSTRALQRVPYL